MDSESCRKILRDVMRGLQDQHASKSKAVGRFVASCRGLDRELQDAALRLAGETLYGELQRHRRNGMRDGYVVRRGGEQLALPLLEQTIAEAWNTVKREEEHAERASYVAEFDRYVVELAEQRCRERGLDPATTEFVVGHFVDEREVEQRWTEWKAAA